MSRLSQEDLGKCSICSATRSLKVCRRCGERLYCSPACQRKDWDSHKSGCKKTTRIDRIDLVNFQSVLATLYTCTHAGRHFYHMASDKKILNVPNSRCAPTRLPDGSLVTLVVLGEQIQRSDSGTRIWWPSAPHRDHITRLVRRILWHGWLMPNYTVLCLTLLLTMYIHPPPIPITKARPQPINKLGLSYKGIPIVDFGIGKGSIKVPPGSQFAYWLAQFEKLGMDGKSQQSPDNHYWMYFTTILGHEFILDCGMHTYGLGLTVSNDFLPNGIFPDMGPVPAYFVDKHVAVVDSKIRTTKERFSVLHDPSLSKLSTPGPFGLSSIDQGIVMKFMEKVKGGQVMPDEMTLVMKLLPTHCNKLGQVLKKHTWESWPKDGFTGYDGLDDGVAPAKADAEPILVHPEFMASCVHREYLKKWVTREYKQEDIQNLEDVVEQYRNRF